MARPPKRLFHLVFESPCWKGLGAESEEKREPVSDIDTGVVDSLKALDPDGRLEKRTHAPQQKIALFDHLVGAGENRGWNIEPDRFGGLQVDDQLVFGRRLHRQIGRLLALQDAIDVAGRTPILVEEIRPVGDQAAGCDEVTLDVDPWQLVASREAHDQIAMNKSQRTAGDDQATIRRTRKGSKRALDLAGIAHVDRAHLQGE